MKEGDKFCSSCGAIVEYTKEADSSQSGMEKAGAGARLISYIVDSILQMVRHANISFGILFGFPLDLDR
ncbi:MAG: hypothetical protein IBX41_03705 [Methanophagales archaeon]|nr:hypothetical protein [Methanophagales archaeon]